MNKIHTLIKRINSEAKLPAYATDGSAGFDLELLEDVWLPAGKIVMVGTGLSVAVPSGYCLLLQPRSSAGTKHDIRLANTTGVIDSDYRGELICALYNYGTQDRHFTKGTKLIQALIVPVFQAIFQEVDELPSTERGEGGFGSTDQQQENDTPQSSNWFMFRGGQYLKPEQFMNYFWNIGLSGDSWVEVVAEFDTLRVAAVRLHQLKTRDHMQDGKCIAKLFYSDETCEAVNVKGVRIDANMLFKQQAFALEHAIEALKTHSGVVL